MQGQEVPDTQDALLLLLNTAISWGRGGSTAPPLHQRVVNYKLGFVSPLWAPAAPALSRASSQTEPAINQTASGKDTHVSLSKIYLPPLSLLKGFFQGHLKHGAIQFHAVLAKCVYLVHCANGCKRRLLKVHTSGEKRKNNFHLIPGSSTSITPKPSISLLVKPFTPCFILLLKINHL